MVGHYLSGQAEEVHGGIVGGAYKKTRACPQASKEKKGREIERGGGVGAELNRSSIEGACVRDRRNGKEPDSSSLPDPLPTVCADQLARSQIGRRI